MNNPLIVMSAVTGKPTDEQIYKYMKMLKNNGISQAMIYPRAGCELDYLSAEWFETISYFIESAQKLNMNIWLFDEFNFPSGNANGVVTAIDEYRLKYIYTSGENIGKVVYAMSDKGHVFGQKFYPNLICEKAVDLFIKETHEKYYEKFGAYFGNVIKGIFTDEPGLAYWKPENAIPYCKEIEEDYKKRYDRDFMTDVYNGHKDLYELTTRIIADKFNKCYISKISDWCRKHGIIMTGHLMEDNDPVGSTRQSGNLLKNLSSFSMPGIDEIRTNFRFETLFNLFGVAEYVRGENGTMAELFALGPCDMTFAKKKCMLYFAACHKINNYFLAVSHMDMRGNLKIKNYFNNFTDDQPDFAGTRLLAKEAEIAAGYADKDFTPDVYIKYPTEICTRNISKKIDIQPFITLINTLTYYQVQWKYIDDEVVSDEIPVIDFTDNFTYIYKGKLFSDATELYKILNTQALVTDERGNIPEGFFVRKFNDNNFIVLNLYGTPGTYLIAGDTVYMDEFGVYISDMMQNKLDVVKESILTTFCINYCNDNMIRAMYVNSQTMSELCCSEDTNVVFAVRNDTFAYLNGQKIICSGTNNHILSAGFQPLYDTTDFISSKQGFHALESEKDCKYLPSVFVIGNFTANIHSDEICDITLSSRKKFIKTGELLSDFGKIEFSTDILIAEGAKAIELVGTNLYTSLFVNDILLGEKICSPYVYEIDKTLWNKTVNLKIVQHSSIAPIFGDLAYYNNSETNKENGTHSAQPNSKTLFGIKEMYWIF